MLIDFYFIIFLILLLIICYLYKNYNYYYMPLEPFRMVYAGTRLCNSRGCDVRYVRECEKGLCLK